jgi:hypothetical protein
LEHKLGLPKPQYPYYLWPTYPSRESTLDYSKGEDKEEEESKEEESEDKESEDEEESEEEETMLISSPKTQGF